MSPASCTIIRPCETITIGPRFEFNTVSASTLPQDQSIIYLTLTYKSLLNQHNDSPLPAITIPRPSRPFNPQSRPHHSFQPPPPRLYHTCNGSIESPHKPVIEPRCLTQARCPPPIQQPRCPSMFRKHARDAG